PLRFAEVQRRLARHADGTDLDHSKEHSSFVAREYSLRVSGEQQRSEEGPSRRHRRFACRVGLSSGLAWRGGDAGPRAIPLLRDYRAGKKHREKTTAEKQRGGGRVWGSNPPD